MVKPFVKKIILALLCVSFISISTLPFRTSNATRIVLKPNNLLKVQGSKLAAQTQVTQDSWSGYAATGPNNTFTSVSSSWVEPTINCANNQTSYSAFWVGLDGYSDESVEQIGTEANCISGIAQYYTWYEMYPQNPTQVLTDVALVPGDNISASVTYNSPTDTKKSSATNSGDTGSFTLAITDETTGLSYSITPTPSSTVDRSSAEVIAEAPYDNGRLPLSNFGSINYSNSEVNGSALGGGRGMQEITMNDLSGLVATPSALDTTEENFSIALSN